jgi:large subunit ribosomal protein L23
MLHKRILIKPVFTEKSMKNVTDKKFTFEVMKDSSKTEIASAIHELFSVDVEQVKTMIRPGKNRRILKTKRFTRTMPRKIAVVTLKEGQTINGFDKLLEVDDAN